MERILVVSDAVRSLLGVLVVIEPL
jgi:hypothetical protein